jgi:cytochrome b
MKTKIWSLPTRIFHWLLTVGVIGAYFLAEEYFGIHMAFGFLVGTLLIFRIVWGFAGPKYSRFSDFNMSKKAFIETYKNKKYPAGHNPLASLVMIAILTFALLTVLSGMLAYASEGKGILAFMGIQGVGVFEDIHKTFINLLLITVALHLLGLVVDVVKNRETSTIGSMFTGYKSVDTEGVRLNPEQKIFSFVWIISAIAVFAITVGFAKQDQRHGESEGHDRYEHHRHGKQDHD